MYKEEGKEKKLSKRSLFDFTCRNKSKSSVKNIWPLKRQSQRQRDPHAKLLHSCKTYASVGEVRRIVEESPESLTRKASNSGQTALHVAASHGADPSVIMYMAQEYPEACAVADFSGKLPLHYVANWSKWSAIPSTTGANFGMFEGCVPCSHGEGVEECDSIYMDMLRVVSLAYPLAIQHEDNYGCNPIEYALIDGAPLRIVRLLQRASVRSWKEQMKTKCHEKKKPGRPSEFVVARSRIEDENRNSVVSRQA
jgi:hypothetical protein